MRMAILNGAKSKSDVADFCFKRLAGNKGVLRKSCNGTGPTNSPWRGATS